MNHLYEAIVSLGRSITEIEKGKWARGELGFFGAPRCANGLLTQNLSRQDSSVAYISYTKLFTPNETQALKLAARALIDAAPDEVWERTIAWHAKEAPHSLPLLVEARSGSDALGRLEAGIVAINDRGGLDPISARTWFSDALEILAKELPVPEQPVFKAEVEEALALMT